MGKIIAVSNQKGGVGKTTTAINLAACLAEAGQKILLIDFDPQGNTTSGFMKYMQKDDIPTAYELICQTGNADDCVVKDILPGLDIITADINLSAAEMEFQELDDKYVKLRNALKTFDGKYDYIIIDCPPSLGILTINAMAAADSVIIPIQCEYYALEGLSQVLKTITIISQKINPKLKVEGILFTMYDQRTNLSEQVVETVTKQLSKAVFETRIPRNIKLAEAPSFGEPIIYYDSSSRGAESYRLLSSEIIRKDM